MTYRCKIYEAVNSKTLGTLVFCTSTCVYNLNMKCLRIAVKLHRQLQKKNYSQTWNTKGFIDVKEQIWPTNIKYEIVNLTCHGH